MSRSIQNKKYQYNSIVKRVIDGDTIVADIDLGFHIVLRDRTVRLVGIDTPETRTSNDLEKQAGLMVKDYVCGLLKEGDEVIIESNELDKFGRVLGDVIMEEGVFSLSSLLIENGYANKYDGGKKEEWTKKKLASILASK